MGRRIIVGKVPFSVFRNMQIVLLQKVVSSRAKMGESNLNDDQREPTQVLFQI